MPVTHRLVQASSMTLSFIIVVFIIGFAEATREFHCWNFKLTDELREQYLGPVNVLRKQTAGESSSNSHQDENSHRIISSEHNATGPPMEEWATTPNDKQNVTRKSPTDGRRADLQFRGDVMPSDEDARWDCVLELEAEKTVGKCNEEAPGPSGAAQFVKKVPLTTCSAANLLKETVTNFFNIADDTTAKRGNQIIGAPKLHSLATLANGHTAKIGCAHKNCNNDLYIACIMKEENHSTAYPINEGGLTQPSFTSSPTATYTTVTSSTTTVTMSSPTTPTHSDDTPTTMDLTGVSRVNSFF
ncbi:hypothetical protein ANCCEY_09651 [Ancylostoma ceylanicum]|uniref:SCP domain-containing protein n=1 Tax=Ancylostoma ceylanicum TaxID=53326 RepID=A0A0D6LGN9_9BILA|nr:hypothetical protein ANCCEY_09651 [Ancylostoma ceylanicum]